jgi:hypothetical protein
LSARITAERAHVREQGHGLNTESCLPKILVVLLLVVALVLTGLGSSRNRAAFGAYAAQIPRVSPPTWAQSQPSAKSGGVLSIYGCPRHSDVAGASHRFTSLSPPPEPWSISPSRLEPSPASSFSLPRVSPLQLVSRSCDCCCAAEGAGLTLAPTALCPL